MFNGRTKLTRDDWETPLSFFTPLDTIFHFTLDPCASKENHKCEKYYTIMENGLRQSWEGETVFCNPPFRTTREWLQKADTEWRTHDVTTVLIMPSRTDNQNWHRYVMRAKQIWFCEGRVNFELDGKLPKNGSNFPLAIIVFGGEVNDKSPLITSYGVKTQKMILGKHSTTSDLNMPKIARELGEC